MKYKTFFINVKELSMKQITHLFLEDESPTIKPYIFSETYSKNIKIVKHNAK